MVRQPPPISLRIRSAEATYRARQILQRLNEQERLQRRVRIWAVRATLALYEMNSIAGPKLESMSPGDRGRWQTDYKRMSSILLKISKRGVG